jgi:uncharacterized membrane protein YebE (DUF533 family)
MALCAPGTSPTVALIAHSTAEPKMFNPERLLGQIMGDAFSGQLGGRGRKRGKGGLMGGLSGGSKAKIGLGLLGVAFAAYQHYQQQPGQAAAQPLAGAGLPPPPPPGTGPSAMPPPPPGAHSSPARVEHAMHLLRAMVTAAHADGLLDASERQAILGRAASAGLDEDDLAALDAEMRAPLTLEQLAVRTSPALRTEVYAAALIAITADTPAERDFLDTLAARLELDADARRDVHAQLGLD